MDVTVLFFASIRGLTGSRELRLSLGEDGLTLGQLFTQLADRYPGLSARRPYLMMAVNGEVRPDDHPVRDRDEVALLPPVSGG